MIGLIGCLLMIMIPFVVFAVTPPNTMDNKTTWYGGPKGDIPAKVDGVTLSEITTRAMEEAAINGRPVEYQTQGGKVIYQAFPDYGRSKCNWVHGKTWEDGKLVQSKLVEVCNRNYEEASPFVPHLSIPGAIR